MTIQICEHRCGDMFSLSVSRSILNNSRTHTEPHTDTHTYSSDEKYFAPELSCKKDPTQLFRSLIHAKGQPPQQLTKRFLSVNVQVK